MGRGSGRDANALVLGTTHVPKRPASGTRACAWVPTIRTQQFLIFVLKKENITQSHDFLMF